ncbi:MAG: hypothetical protein U9R34_02785 [Nanoarchaeota archaeon]|nr:hypothetical protein [Nanoarchaeota archaeon]
MDNKNEKRGDGVMKADDVKPISYNTIKKNTNLNRFFEKKEEECSE